MKRTLLERFLDKVSPEPLTGCWLWTGMLQNSYGILWLGRKPALAHRISWTLFRGEIPAGLRVCHHCDVRACVNPDHLFLGTAAENSADMKRKGRSPLGEKNSGAKLNNQQVRAIKALLAGGVKTQAIAVRFGVTAATVRCIKKGQSWRHIQLNRHEGAAKQIGETTEKTTMADFKEAFVNTLKFEDAHLSGKVTVDAGGRTRFGIAARFHPDLPEEFFTGPAEDALAEAEKIEEAGYWNVMRLGEVRDQHVANKLFDMGVNMGVRQAAVLAQRAANALLQDGAQPPGSPSRASRRGVELPSAAIRLIEDGVVGARTLAAINALDPATYVQVLRELSADLYRHIASINPAQAVNLPGWLRRAAA